MKLSTLVLTTTALLGLPFALSSLAPSADAATFDQKELDQGKVIAVAVPLAQGNRYNLLIVEQLANTRPCWQETPSAPGSIEPLLLQFDFTDICGRSTDSNGYSIRLAGEDKGLEYRLSVARRNNHLVLLGVPSRNGGAAPPIEIAQTQTSASGFLKLNLNPGWRFTKRIYQGKTLGHIYLTRDAMPSGADAIAMGGETEPRQIFPVNRPSAKTALRPLNRPSAYNSNKVFPLSAPVEIPVPDPLNPLPRQTSAVFPIPSAPPLSGAIYNNNASILPVPAVNIPMGNAGNEPDLITANTPNLNLNVMMPGAADGSGSGFPVAMVNPNAYRYRVYVNPTDLRQRNAVKTLVPDSFRSSYRGLPVLQVGAFNEREKADAVIALLSRNGITSILATDQ